MQRREVCRFTDKQIALVENFAAQAVIAIENARLLNELRQRTTDLTESLEQQTATSDVLSIISSSPGELEPVFQTMLENAVRICDAKFGFMNRYDGDAWKIAAVHGAAPAYTDYLQQRGYQRPGPETVVARIASTNQIVHIADLAASRGYAERDPVVVAAVELGGVRTLLGVPMLKEGELIGAILLYRQEVRPFTDKQIALVQNFAAQAVIAIENTRLLNELRESLEQQTATSAVLSVISSSPGELEPVFQAMLENAVRICEANFGTLFRFEGETYYAAATHNAPQELMAEYRRQGLRGATPGGMLDRMLRTKQVCHTADYAAESVLGTAARFGGARSIVLVPMLKDNVLIGAFSIYRQEVRPFTDKQIALLQNFADQAVIAIENTRLLNELRQSLEQQTATSEVLSVISSSPGELEPVFQAMLENATRICEAKFGVLNLYENGALRMGAMHNVPPAFAEWLQNQRGGYRPIPGSPLDNVIRTKQLSVTVDHAVEAAPGRATTLGGARSTVCVPMIKDDQLVGTITIYRQEVRPFTDKQSALLTNFAAQAVIAIENTRLLNELRQRTTDLSKSLEDLRTAQDRLVQTQKLASLGQLTAGIAQEIKNPLNFVNNFSGVSVELIGELQETLGRVNADDKTRGEITELAETLRDNLGKIVQHGKRADSIVKNMLLHSREGSGERRPVDVNALVEESLNLAYHGARAETQGFNITLDRSFDPMAGEADVFPQEITRVLLNLISNSFYATTKRQGQESSNGFEPTITAATKSLGDRVEIRIRDNGTGIPSEVREKMFNPFFTTKPAGEGTGLGLSISHDIIVKQHSGSIEVDTEPGLFTEFRIILPRSAA
jgi:two-component system NtrC family sensor kinase